MKLKPSIYNKEGEALISDLVSEIFYSHKCSFRRDLIITLMTSYIKAFASGRHFYDWTRPNWTVFPKLNIFELARTMADKWILDNEDYINLEALLYRIEIEFTNIEVNHLRTGTVITPIPLALKQLKNQDGELIPLRPSFWSKHDRGKAISLAVNKFHKKHPRKYPLSLKAKEEITSTLKKYSLRCIGDEPHIQLSDYLTLEELPIKDSYQLAKAFENKYLIDLSFVEMIDKLRDFIFYEFREMIRDWIDKYQPQPPLAIGSQVFWSHDGAKSYEGVIKSIPDWAMAGYVVSYFDESSNEMRETFLLFEHVKTCK